MGKNLVLPLVVAALIHMGALNGIAGFEEGVAAYKKGDYATAFKEYLQLAQQGDVRAQLNLGLMYQTGKGVPRDDKEALKWYFRATEKMNNDAIIQRKQKNPHQ